VRLYRREQFTTTLAAGDVRTRRHFRLYVRRNGLSQARIGIITGRRVAPRAVDRNRVKRMVREAFRTLAPRPAGVDLVVELRRCPARDAGETVRAELARLLDEVAAETRGG
jgi:ribonuclease P protein component